MNWVGTLEGLMRRPAFLLAGPSLRLVPGEFAVDQAEEGEDESGSESRRRAIRALQRAEQAFDPGHP